jgi:hypothetical protein
VTVDPRRADITSTQLHRSADDSDHDIAEPGRRRALAIAGAGVGIAALGIGIGPLAHLFPVDTANGAESPEITLATFISSLELSTMDLYEAAEKTGKLTADPAQLATTFRQHHQIHFNRLSALVGDGGGTAPSTGNAGLVKEYQPRITGAADEAALMGVLGSLEEALAATYASALGSFVSSALASVAAQILPVDGQHAVAWSAAATPGGTPPHQPAPEAVPALQTEQGAITVTSVGADTIPTTTGAAS